MWNDGPVYMDDAITADCIQNPSYPTNTFLGRCEMSQNRLFLGKESSYSRIS